MSKLLMEYLLNIGRELNDKEVKFYNEFLEEDFNSTGVYLYDLEKGDSMDEFRELINSPEEALQYIIGISLDYDGFRKSDSLMGLIDELREIAVKGLRAKYKEDKKERTIEEWEEIKQVKIIDPDGFDRTDENLYKRKFTEGEFDKGLLHSTLEINIEDNQPAEYEKRPVRIEAVRWLGTNYSEVDNFITGGHTPYPEDGLIVVETLEGDMKARIGDYIIKGVEGEFYPCKPNIFHKSYKKVGGDN